jgi:predicted dienelactone hydrolase
MLAVKQGLTMRPFELLVLVTLLPVLVGFLLRRGRRPAWLQMLAWSTVVILLLHLWLEKYRWQMVPAYGLVVLLGLLGLRKVPGNEAKDSRWQMIGRSALVVLGLLVWAVTAFLALKLPVFPDPATTGPFAVGTTCLYFTDSSRQDSFAPDPHTPRELPVVVWYPAEITPGTQPEPLLPEVSVTGPVIAHLLHLPPFILAHLQLVKSRSYPDVPVARARAKYPVLIFSHGYGGTPRQNTPQMEELASHGFIIFSIGHTYESAALAFPQGRVVPISEKRLETVTRSAKSEGMEKLNEQLRTATNPVVIRQIAAQMTPASGAQESLAVWVADTQYLMDELAKGNAATDGGAGPAKRFASRLDLAQAGVFGMSFGGATAGELCMKAPRFKAGLNMDGKQSGDVMNQRLSVPFLYFSSESSQEDRKINDAVYENSLADFYSIHVNHTAHANFSDLGLIMPILKSAGLLGAINPQEMEKIMNAYTLAFFQKYLEGKPAPLLEGPPPAGEFPEVVFAAHGASTPRSE